VVTCIGPVFTAFAGVPMVIVPAGLAWNREPGVGFVTHRLPAAAGKVLGCQVDTH